ncbi:hypothetical protein JCM8097_003161, partial [Rhodosporidiobolus ruineniae]
MGKKHRSKKPSTQAQAAPQTTPAASQAPPPPFSAALSSPPTLPKAMPGTLDFPPTPPDSPQFSPSKLAPPPSRPATVTAEQKAVEAALEQLALGFPGRAYTLLATSTTPPTFVPSGRSADVDALAAHLVSAQTSLAKGYWQQAVQDVEAAEALWRKTGVGEVPWEGVKWKMLGLEGAKRWNDVEALATDSLVTRSSQAQFLLYYLALSQYHLGKLVEAEATLTRAQKAKKGEDGVVGKVRSLVAQVRKLSEFKDKGKTAFQAQKYQDAIGHYSSGIIFDPENRGVKAILLSNRALAYFKVGDFKTCITDCHSCLLLSPAYVKALHTRSKAHAALGDYVSALGDLSRAIELVPKGSEERKKLEEEKREVETRKVEREKREKAEAERRRKEEEERRKQEWEAKHPDHYKALGIERNATADEIRLAYK